MDSGFVVKSKDNSYVDDTSRNGLSTGGSYSYSRADSAAAHRDSNAYSMNAEGGGQRSVSLSRSAAASSIADPGQKWIQDIMEGSRAQVASLKEAANAKRNERRQSLPRSLPESALPRTGSTSRPIDAPQYTSKSASSMDQLRHSNAHYTSNGFDRRSGNFSEPLGYPSQHNHLPAKYGGTYRLPWETQASVTFSVGTEQSAHREPHDQTNPATSDGAPNGIAQSTGFSAADAAARIANEYRLAAAMGRQEPRASRHRPAPSVPVSVSAQARDAPISVADRKVAAAQKQMERKLKDHAVVLQKRASANPRPTSNKARPAARVQPTSHDDSAAAKRVPRASLSLPRPRAPPQSSGPLMSAEAVLRHRRVELAVASSQKEEGGRSEASDTNEENATASLHGPSRRSGSIENGRRSSSSRRSYGDGDSGSNKSRSVASAGEAVIASSKARKPFERRRVSSSPTRSSYSEGRYNHSDRKRSTPSPQDVFSAEVANVAVAHTTGSSETSRSPQDSTQERFPESTDVMAWQHQAQDSRTNLNARSGVTNNDYDTSPKTVAGLASSRARNTSPYPSQHPPSPTNTINSGFDVVAAARARADALKLEASAAAPQPLAFLPPSAALRRRMEKEAQAADPYYWAQEQVDARSVGGSAGGRSSHSISSSHLHHHSGLMGADEVAWRREQRRHGGGSSTPGLRSSPELPTDWVSEMEAQSRTHEDAAAEAVKAAQREAAESSVVEAAMYAAACESDAYSVNAQGFSWRSAGRNDHYHGQVNTAEERRQGPSSSSSDFMDGAHTIREDTNAKEEQRLSSVVHLPTQAFNNEAEEPNAATYQYLQAMRRLQHAQSPQKSPSLEPEQLLEQPKGGGFEGDASTSDLTPLVLVPEPPNYDLLEAHDRAMDKHEQSSSGERGGGKEAQEQTERLPKIVRLWFGTNVLGRTTPSSSSPSKHPQNRSSSNPTNTVGLDNCDIPEALLRAYHTTKQGVRCYLLSQRHVALTVRPDGVSAHVEALAFLQASHALVRINGRALAPSSPPQGGGGSMQGSGRSPSKDGANAGSQSGGGGAGGALLKVGDKLTLLGGVSKQAPPYAAVRTRAGDLTFTLQRNPAYVQQLQQVEQDNARAVAAMEEANRRMAPRTYSPPLNTAASSSGAVTSYSNPRVQPSPPQIIPRSEFGSVPASNLMTKSPKIAWKEEQRKEGDGSESGSWEARVSDAGWEARVEAAAAEITTTHRSSPAHVSGASADANSAAANHHSTNVSSSSPNAQSSPPSSPHSGSSRRNNKSPGSTPLTERGLLEAVAQVTAEEVKFQGQIDALLEEKRVAVVAKQYLTAGHISAQLAKVRASLNCAKVKRDSLAKQAEALAAELVAEKDAAARDAAAEEEEEEKKKDKEDRAPQAPVRTTLEAHASEGAIEAAARAAAAAEVDAMSKAATWSAHFNANQRAGTADGAMPKQVVWEDEEAQGNQVLGLAQHLRHQSALSKEGGSPATHTTAPAPQSRSATVERALALAAAARAAAEQAEVAAAEAEANAARSAADGGGDGAREATSAATTTRRSPQPNSASPTRTTATTAALGVPVSPVPFQAFSPSAFVSTAHTSKRVSLASAQGSKQRQSHSLRRDEASAAGSDAFNGSLYDGDGDDLASSYYDNESVLESSVAGTSISQSTALLRSLGSKSGHGYQSVAERRAARQQRRNNNLSGRRRFDERGTSAHSVASGYSAASERVLSRPHVSPPGESITAEDFDRRRREVMRGYGSGGGSEYGVGYNNRSSNSLSQHRNSRTMSERGGRSHSSSRSESAKLLSSATPLVQAYGRAHGGETAAQLASPRLAAEMHARAMDQAASHQSTQARKVKAQGQRSAEAASAAHRDASHRIARLLDLKTEAVAAEDYALADKYKQQISTLEAYLRDVATASIEQELQALAGQKDEAVAQEDYAKAAALKAKMGSLRLRLPTSQGRGGGAGGLSHNQGDRQEHESTSSPASDENANEDHLALATRAMRDRGYAPKVLVDFGQTSMAGLDSSHLGHGHYEESWHGELAEGRSFRNDGESTGWSNREEARWRPAGAVALPGMIPDVAARNS